jgi:hypothetical protein
MNAVVAEIAKWDGDVSEDIVVLNRVVVMWLVVSLD